MKLFAFKKRNDYGTDLYFSILETKRYTLFQSSISYGDYPSWPYAQIMFGNGKLFGLFFYVWKFGFDFDILGRTWRI